MRVAAGSHATANETSVRDPDTPAVTTCASFCWLPPPIASPPTAVSMTGCCWSTSGDALAYRRGKTFKNITERSNSLRITVNFLLVQLPNQCDIAISPPIYFCEKRKWNKSLSMTGRGVICALICVFRSHSAQASNGRAEPKLEVYDW